MGCSNQQDEAEFIGTFHLSANLTPFIFHLSPNIHHFKLYDTKINH